MAVLVRLPKTSRVLVRKNGVPACSFVKAVFIRGLKNKYVGFTKAAVRWQRNKGCLTAWISNGVYVGTKDVSPGFEYARFASMASNLAESDMAMKSLLHPRIARKVKEPETITSTRSNSTTGFGYTPRIYSQTRACTSRGCADMLEVQGLRGTRSISLPPVERATRGPFPT